MSEKQDQEDNSKDLSSLELLKILKGISDYAKDEISSVRRMYGLAAALLTSIIVVGMYFTYKDASQIRKEARDEIYRQEQQMEKRFKDMQDNMNQKVSKFQHDVENQTDTLQNKVQQSLESEVKKIQETVKQRLDKEFETKAIHDLIENKAKEYTETTAKRYIDEKVDAAIKPFYAKLKEDTDKFTKYIKGSEAETKILEERLKKSIEETLNLSAKVKMSFEGEVMPAPQVPEEIAVVYVYLQNPATLEDGSSELLGRVSRDEFIKKFGEYNKIAKSKQMKLIVRASTADEKQWLQTQIKYKDNFLKETNFWEPSQNKIIEGAEVPLN